MTHREVDDEERDIEESGWGTRILTAILALIVGAIYGAVGTVAHQSNVELFGVSVPWGIILALIGVAALLVGIRLVIADRLVVGAAAVGVIGTIVLLSLKSAGGSVLIPGNVVGTIWVIGPALIAAGVLAWPRLPARRSEAAHA